MTGRAWIQSMLGVARQKCPGVNFQQGSVTKLPFDDNSFDLVVSSFMLMFLDDPVGGVREMSRVLRPDGRIVVSVWQGLSDNPVYDALVSATRTDVGDQAATSIAWPFTMGDSGRLSGTFSEAGLDGVSIEAHDGVAEFPSVEKFVHTEVQAWLLADKVDGGEIEKVCETLRETYPDFSESTGAIKFPLNALIASAARTDLARVSDTERS